MTGKLMWPSHVSEDLLLVSVVTWARQQILIDNVSCHVIFPVQVKGTFFMLLRASSSTWQDIRTFLSVTRAKLSSFLSAKRLQEADP